jgi:hypothetical protein
MLLFFFCANLVLHFFFCANGTILSALLDSTFCRSLNRNHLYRCLTTVSRHPKEESTNGKGNERRGSQKQCCQMLHLQTKHVNLGKF